MVKVPNDITDGSAGPSGPYDGRAADPWFQPDDSPAPDLAPFPQADRRRLIDPGSWAAAQGALAVELADLALLYGRLDERLRVGPPGWRHRLALREAAEISWAVGDRVSAERLGLWEAQHLSGVQDDAQALARASWVLRRLLAAPVGLADFLGRPDVADLATLRRDLAGLHPVVRAVALAQGWRLMGGQGAAEQTVAVEAMVLAGRFAGEMGGGAGFVPQGMGQGGLAGWLQGAILATRAALSHLERLGAWQVRAGAALADLQGRTPGRLLTVLAEWPMITVPMATVITGANKATVQRNLDRMQARGLIREITGQGRYRVWTARI